MWQTQWLLRHIQRKKKLENSDMSRHYLKTSIIFHRKVKCKIISSKNAKKQYRMVKNKVFNYENSKASNAQKIIPFSLIKKKKRVYFHHTYEPFSKASTIAKLLCVRIDLVSNLLSYTRKKGEVLIQYKFYVTILKFFFYDNY